MTSAARLPIVVQKYGGSSVADVARIQAVADRIVATCQGGRRVVAVVSAMGKTTDSLIKLAHEVTPSPDRRELDMLLTAGERISMSLLAMAVRARGLPATSLTGSQCGILTNDSPGGARIVEVRPFRVEDALDQGHVVIVAGFQGVSYRREVTTLGRGGSDTTAVALAAALGAESCEIYSDVDGVYTADPRLVKDARRLDAMTHDEMLALARCGAKVLGSDAVAYARMHGIALYARASDHRGVETMVRRDLPHDRPAISGVAARPCCVLLRYDGGEATAWVESALAVAQVAPLFLHDPGLQHDTADPLSFPVVNGGAPTGSPGACTVLLGRDVADTVDPAFDALVDGLVARLGASLQARVDGTLVSIVGPAVGREAGLLGQFRAAVAAATAPVLAHGLALSVLLPASSADGCVLRLHERFLGDAVQSAASHASEATRGAPWP